MIIAVNTRLLIKNKLEGIGRFAYETLSRITVQHPEHTFVFIFDRNYEKEFIFSSNVIPVIIGPQARHPILFFLWFEFSVKKILAKYKADIFVSPDGYLSLSTNVKSLAVIHDLNFEHYPDDLPCLIGKYYRYFFPRFAKKASRIATVSKFSKQDIIHRYGISEDKIDVVYNGPSDIFKPAIAVDIESTRSKYANGKPYFLYVGSLHPRKNIGNLFKAFDLFRKKTKADIKLLITGEKYYWTDEMQKVYESLEFKQDIIFTGRINDLELAKVMPAALALTYVSYFEGFGIPVVEAMQCDVPVITSNQTSLPEIAGNAALLTDPFSVESIAHAMSGIYNYPALRKELIEKGRIRREKYSWQKTSELLFDSICKAVK
ncbi:MAG: glycosyltransferase family 4 protein [Bacteroidetes bacterium]|nr:glycosyltransferase family 4 protein [Bacteroidota bacterium]HET6245756.1 glycosyltransferase family 1 protein [Bacteroidia bacterium]